MKKALSLLSLAVASCLASTVAFAGDLLYTKTASTVLPSTNTWWDYVKMQPGSNRLFMARVADGLTVFDVDKYEVIKNIENSKGANGPLLLPDYNRGYIAMTDGTLLIVDLKTLETIDRVQLDPNGGLNSGIYDPVTREVYFITGTRKKDATWYVIDPSNDKLLRSHTFPFRKMDDPATDGKGTLFAPARYDDIILKIESGTFKEKERWDMPCHVSKVYYEQKTKRLFAACLGDTPRFMAIHPDTGKIIAEIPIGSGLDAMVFDEKRNRIITSTFDGYLNVIQQDGPDTYQLLGSVSTERGSRMMHIDDRTGYLHVVNAPFTMGPKGEEYYHPDTFTVFKYEPQ